MGALAAAAIAAYAGLLSAGSLWLLILLNLVALTAQSALMPLGVPLPWPPSAQKVSIMGGSDQRNR
jgi:hypothetical protein